MRYSIGLLGALVFASACEFQTIRTDDVDAKRLAEEEACPSYCDAVMPCDVVVNASFRDFEDCMDSCMGVTEEISAISMTCAQAHVELVLCLGDLTCDESLDFLSTGPGEDPNCGEEEQQVLTCQ